ncbi:MAG TPA: PAS domain-containing sensor histidine kinase, partial [Deinococcales bacterium]|nr:PAS domain-containing sensor histidine kinase [Deinococcales bacterium]
PCRITAAPARDANGRLAGWAGTLTERPEALAATGALAEELHRRLVESEARFLLAADHAPMPLWMSGTDKLCDWFNKPWLEFTGRAMEQELGNGWAEGVHPDDFDACLETYVGSFDRREAFSMTYRLRRHDGQYRWVLDNGVPRYAPDGEFLGYIGTGIDIHPMVEAHAELERKVQERTAALTAANEEQEAFIYTVSHDLRSPLRAIGGMIELASQAVQRGDGEEAAFLAARVSANVQRMNALIEDLLALSRAGRSGEDARPLHLGEATQLALSDLAPTASLELPGEWPRVLMPPTELGQVLTNLLSNAMKWAGRDAGQPYDGPPARECRVRVTWTRDGDHVTLCVGDNGPGIPTGKREQVFGLFKKLDAKSDGTGAGLTIVKRTVERHGGKAWVDASTLGGAALNVTLPAAD